MYRPKTRFNLYLLALTLWKDFLIFGNEFLKFFFLACLLIEIDERLVTKEKAGVGFDGFKIVFFGSLDKSFDEISIGEIVIEVRHTGINTDCRLIFTDRFVDLSPFGVGHGQTIAYPDALGSVIERLGIETNAVGPLELAKYVSGD